MKLMNKKYNNFYFVIHSTEAMRNIILDKISDFKDDNYQIVTNPNIKEDIIKHSFFAVSKSGTVSLEICKYEVPSIIIYKMNPINFFFIKRMIKTKFANIINIINKFLLNNIKVNFTFLNIVNKKNLFQRLKKRKSLSRYDQFDMNFYNKVQKGFLKLAKSNKKSYKIIDSNLDIKKNEDLILNQLQKLIK